MLTAGRVGVGDGDLGGVLTLGRLGVGLGDTDALLSLRLGRADLAVALLLGHLDLGLVDGTSSGLTAEGVDVARLVGDVLDVDVDQLEADLAELDLEGTGDVVDQTLAVGVDLLDRHGGDDHTHLAEDDVSGERLDLGDLLVQQALGGVLHDARLLGHGDREGGRRVHADVLLRQRTLELDVDRDRGQVEPGVALDDGEHERAAALVELCGLAGAAGAAVDHEDAVRWTALVAAGHEHDEAEDDGDTEDDEGNDCHGGFPFRLVRRGRLWDRSCR